MFHNNQLKVITLSLFDIKLKITAYMIAAYMTRKLISLHILTQRFGKHFLFHSNLYIDLMKTRQFPKCYQEIL